MAELFRMKLKLVDHGCSCGECASELWWKDRYGNELFEHESLLDNVEGLPDDVEEIEAVFHDRPGKNRFEAKVKEMWDWGVSINGLVFQAVNTCCQIAGTWDIDAKLLDELLERAIADRKLKIGKKVWVEIEF